MKDAKTRKKDTSATDQSLFFSESGDSSLFDDLDDSILASIDLNVSLTSAFLNVNNNYRYVLSIIMKFCRWVKSN